MTISRKQNLNGLRKYSGKWQLCTLFYTLQSKVEAQGGYMKSIGDRLGRWGVKTLGLDKKVK